ncbi:lytic transglycosylase domain-containing protein [Burkholderia sp. Cy-637]|uniref:lytic transglycosylase domain-containing protein n=1 Tax=Burkholderia sp. Cy-637 TaxID=2608327 RepID=UPI00141F663B|nr:lytic transglycosylase domain-containing protein [Burkholderia sp. Cy-637]NIF88877.1 lytic transglycosylase domain-containing protein [Burkholderia sp. Cy-637]
MADEIEKFVLQYQVDTKDSMNTLQTLDNRMSKVSDTAVKSGKDVKSFAARALESKAEISSLGSSVTGLVSNLGKVSPVTAGAAAGLLALHAVMRSVAATMKEMNEQAALGMKIGTGGLQVEIFQRSISKASNGRIGAEQSRSVLERLGTMSQSAYTDPLQNNGDAQRLRYVGVQINDEFGRLKSADTIASELAKNLANSRQQEAYALGQVVGLNYQEVDALRAVGKAQEDLSGMTEGQAQSYIAASKAAAQLTSAYGDIDESMRRIKQSIADEFMPAFADLMSGIAKGTKFLSGSIEKFDENSKNSANDQANMGEFLLNVSKGITEAFKKGGSASDVWSNIERAFTDATAEGNKQAEAQGKREEAASKATLDQARKVAQESHQAAGQFNRAINSFSGAVSAFSNSIVDQNRAWAAWAGEIGAAAFGNPDGKSGDANQPTGGKGYQDTPATFNSKAYEGTFGASVVSAKDTNQYDPLIREAAAKYNVDPLILKRIMAAESRFDQSAVSPKGAIGLMQIMPSNAKGLGVTVDQLKNDPRVNVMAGARIYSENLKRYGGDVEKALLAYNGGTDSSKWGQSAENAAYYGRVMGQNVTFDGRGGSLTFPQSPSQSDAYNPKAQGTWTFQNNGSPYGPNGGESRRTVRAMDMARGSIASALGIPVDQLSQGQVSSGDVKFASGEVMTSLQNSIIGMRQSLNAPGLMPQQRGRIQQSIVQAEMQRQALSENAGYFASIARPGDREMTLGQTRSPVVQVGRVSIQVTGSGDPVQTAAAVKDAFSDHIGSVVNNNARGIVN